MGRSLIIVIGIAALAAVIVSARAGEVSSHVLYERPDGLWGRWDTEAAQCLCDRAHYERIDLDGAPSYVLLRFDERKTWIKVLRCDASGAVRQAYTITGKPLRDATAIENINRVGNHQIEISLHVSPRAAIRVALNLATGTKTIRRSAPE